MSGEMHGRPTAVELIDATIVFLRDQLSDQLDGAAKHQVRIAVHALEMVSRQLASQEADDAAHLARLASLGIDSDAGLAEAIRSGTLADGPELRQVLLADTRERLLVANPRWLNEQP